MNHHIEDFLKKYIKEPSSDYAVMIDGEWGSGKTYFINSFIKNNTTWWFKKFCYCSLYGLTDNEDFQLRIKRNLFFAKIFSMFFVSVFLIIPILSIIYYACKQLFIKDAAENIILIATAIIPIITSWIIIITYAYKKLEHWLLSNIINKMVLIFDDLERTECTTRYALSLINYYVEQQHCKVIIIGNSKEIFRKNKVIDNNGVENENNEYETTREKVIGKTFFLAPDHDEIISYLTKSIKNKIIRDVCEEKISEICDFIKSIDEIAEKKHTNYRSIKHAYLNFTSYFENIITQIHPPKKKNVTWELFCRYFVVEYGMQIGTFSPENISDIIYFYKNSYDNNDPIAKKYHQFKSKFKQWDGNYFLAVDTWVSIFNNHVLNHRAILTNIDDTICPEARENWIELWFYYEKNDEDIEKWLASVKSDIERRNYKDPVVIIHVFAILLEMSKNQIIGQSTTDILNCATQYMEDIMPTLEYNDVDFNLFDLLRHGNKKTHLSLKYDNDEGIDELIEKLKNTLERKVRDNKTIRYNEMIELLKQYTRFQTWARSEQGYKDIYSGQNPELLWNAWIELSPQKFRDVGFCFSDSIISSVFHKYPNTGDFWKVFFNRVFAYIEGNKDSNGIIITNKAQCVFLQNVLINDNKKLIEKLNTPPASIEPALPIND